MAYLTEPVGADTLASLSGGLQQTSGYDHHGKLMIRIGTVHMLAGRLDDALAAYRRVVRDYPRSPLSAEAQYRSGYAYEVLGDDFEKALKGNAKLQAEGEVYVHADQALPYGDVVKVMAALSRNGGGKIGLVTDPLK